jgi:TetR/AcrR family transcriptional regulator, copper-responsive repressor
MKTKDAKEPKARGRPRGFDREEALERAMELFWRQGYESTSIADLTKAMGINPPSLYATFGDKARLFLEAVEHYGCKGRQSPESILEEAPSAREAVERLLQNAAREFSDTCHPPGCMVVSAATNCSASSVPVQEALAARRKMAEAKIRQRLERGMKAGELPPRTACAALAKFYTTVIEGMSIQARDGASRKSLLATAAAAMRAWPDARSGR